MTDADFTFGRLREVCKVWTWRPCRPTRPRHPGFGGRNLHQGQITEPADRLPLPLGAVGLADAETVADQFWQQPQKLDLSFAGELFGWAEGLVGPDPKTKPVVLLYCPVF